MENTATPKAQQSKPRVAWIDMAKGIGILLVIFGHSGISKVPLAVIYTFHMPIFFFLSGLVLNVKKNESFLVFLKKTQLAWGYPIC